MQRPYGVLFGLALAGEADAGEAYRPPNRDTLWYTNSLFVRVNPLGLIDTFRLGYKHRLQVSDTAFGRDAYVFAGASVVASPAFGRIGAHVEVEPVSPLRFSATYEFVGYFGTFGQVQGFPGPDVDYSDSALEVGDEAGRDHPRIGHVLTLGAQAKFKVEWFAFRNTFTAVRYDLNLPAGEVAFYDQTYDRLAPDGGFLLLNDLDLMGVFHHLRVGARYTWTDSLYAGSPETAPGDMPNHRLGPMLAWQFRDGVDRSRWDRPTIFLLTQWWLQHPWRTGADTSQALPLIALGLSFEGDMLWEGRRGDWKPKEERIPLYP